MASTVLRVHRFKKVRWLYLAGFIAYIHFAFVLYVNSNFIGDIVGERFVGFVYIAAALLSLITIIGASRVLREIGNYRALVIFAAIEMAIMLGIAVLENRIIIVLLDILFLAIEPPIFLALDIFLENYSQPELGEDDRTGNIRGLYLGIVNASFILAPFAMGAIVGFSEQFRNVYFVSVFLLIPFLAIIALKFRRFIDPEYYKVSAREIVRSLKGLFHNKDLAGVFASQFFLRLFYAWSVIYMPLYLHAHLGFPWPVLGAILALTQIPYVIFEIPLGRIADKYLGEKEFMILGFLILGGGIAAFSYTTTPSILFWSSVLYFTNVGGSLVEVSTESYFFKKVDGRSAHTISLFRMIQPSATLLGTILGSALLFFLPLRYLFTVFAGIVLIGILSAAIIKDTR